MFHWVRPESATYGPWTGRSSPSSFVWCMKPGCQFLISNKLVVGELAALAGSQAISCRLTKLHYVVSPCQGLQNPGIRLSAMGQSWVSVNAMAITHYMDFCMEVQLELRGQDTPPCALCFMYSSSWNAFSSHFCHNHSWQRSKRWLRNPLNILMKA